MAHCHDHEQDEGSGRGAIDCNGNWYPLMPTLEEQNRARDRAVNNLWDKYQRGFYKRAADGTAPRSKVEYMDDKYLHVSKVYHAFTDDIINIDVSSKDPDLSPNLNFISYDAKDRCLAFRGQACHYGSFYSLAQLLLLQDRIDQFYKARSEVKFPEEGLEPGLDYQTFAGRVEIVEYAAWLKETPSHARSAETMALLSYFRDNSPVYEPPSMNPRSEEEVEAQVLGPAAVSAEIHTEPGGVHEECSAFDAAISIMEDVQTSDSGRMSHGDERLTAPIMFPGEMDNSTTKDIHEEQHSHGTVSLALSDCQAEKKRIALGIEQHRTSQPSLMDVDNDPGLDRTLTSTMTESLDVPMVEVSMTSGNSPWSLFGEVDDQEMMSIEPSIEPVNETMVEGVVGSTNESATESPVSSPLTVMDVEAVGRPSPTAREGCSSAVDAKPGVSGKMTEQEESDAALAARLAAQTPDRYSLRRHTRSTSAAEFDWLKTPVPAKQITSSKKPKPESPVQMRPARKGTARKKSARR